MARHVLKISRLLCSKCDHIKPFRGVQLEVKILSQFISNISYLASPIKPPQLKITPFDGDVLKWQEFWDQFEASIDKAHYSPIDKLNYLKSKLKGEALSAISGYQLSNNNYSVVVDVLKHRFGNPQLIIDAHYCNLSHLLIATNRTGSLRQCFDAIECHLCSLEAIGENVNHR